jgi:L-ascorbate metabolism protein UlaG (beta-lactamase superfamily)
MLEYMHPMIILIIVVILAVSIWLFVGLAPQFGKPPHGDHLNNIKKSPQYRISHFENLKEIKLRVSFVKLMTALWEMVSGGENRRPKSKLPSYPLSTNESKESYLTWFGHSTFLYEVENKKIMFDPMLTDYASPMPGLIKRYDYDLPASAEDLPDLDVVIISHDHYDHLDYKTVKALIHKTKLFVVPLGVGSHLKHWGVVEESIVELDWWGNAQIDGVTISAVPSQHFSGRSLNDSKKTLWAAWIIKNETTNIFFGGDSGYFDGFKEIGEKLGPFDMTLIDSGQYNDIWSSVHMKPEESVQAHKDLRGRVYMPIHWSAFTLSTHSWTEPVERALAAADAFGVDIITPMIGERFNVLTEAPSKKWWTDPDLVV